MARQAVDEIRGAPAPTASRDYGGERVLVVPRAAVLDEAGWRGVRTGTLEQTIAAIAERGEFQPRAEVEDDPGWKQPIPYLVLRDGGRLFLMRRSRAGADARLHDRYSIGIGGHVNPADGGVDGALRRGGRGEIDADFEPEFRPLGLLNDDSDPVGAVHLGLVYVAEAAGRPVRVRETEKLSGDFVATGEVERVRDRLETWSALLFDFLVTARSGGRASGVR